MSSSLTRDRPSDAVLVERLFGGHPILSPIQSHDWESRVVLNPAGVLIHGGEMLERLMTRWELPEESRSILRSNGGACALLYRAQGDVEPLTGLAPSSIGFAVTTPELQVLARRSSPVLKPGLPFQNLGVEDPRSVRIDDRFFLTYTGYAQDEIGDRRVFLCSAESDDLVHWSDMTPVAGTVNRVNNKNGVLLPHPVDDWWYLLHRPMEEPDAMQIHLARSRSVYGPWEERGAIMSAMDAPGFANSWIGAAGPPIHLDGPEYLMIYHCGRRRPDGTRRYELGAAILRFDQEPRIVSRLEALLLPETEFERTGDAEVGVDDVVFSCANYVWKDWLYIPYAGADSCVLGARVRMEELVSSLRAGERSPVIPNKREGSGRSRIPDSS